MFFKKEIKEEFVKTSEVNKKIEDLTIKLNDFEIEIEKIKSHIISLRGFVNRRMSGQDLPEETIKNTDGLDGLRFNKKSG